MGGTLAAKPTCQLLPPAIPGYRRYCRYTDDPSDDGRWKATDLARAKRLVAASGTRGTRVVVWNTIPSPSGGIEETRLAVAALRKLGYHAMLRLLPESTFFTYTGDSRNPRAHRPTVTPNAVDVVSRHIHNYQYNPVWGALLDQLTIT